MKALSGQYAALFTFHVLLVKLSTTAVSRVERSHQKYLKFVIQENSAEAIKIAN